MYICLFLCSRGIDCISVCFCVVGVSIVSLFVFSVVGVSIVSLFVFSVVGVSIVSLFVFV